MKEKIKLMISKINNSKKAFNKLLRNGYYEFRDKENIEGGVALVNDKAIIAFLHEEDDETKVVGTVAFKDCGVVVYQLNGENFSRQQFGCQNLFSTGIKIPTYNLEDIEKDISTIYKHYAEVKEKSDSKFPFLLRKRFKTKLSKKDVSLLLGDTIDKLNKTRNKVFCEKISSTAKNNKSDEETVKHNNMEKDVDKTFEI